MELHKKTSPWIFAALLLPALASPAPAKVRIVVDGMSAPYRGNLMVGIYSSQSNFPMIGKEMGKKTIPASEKVVCEFDEIPPGKYAISAFHDVNSNGILDKNYLGIPLEGYGFSKNARGVVSAPTFEEAAFDYSGRDMVVTIHIH